MGHRREILPPQEGISNGSQQKTVVNSYTGILYVTQESTTVCSLETVGNDNGLATVSYREPLLILAHEYFTSPRINNGLDLKNRW
jgi:hypothetical protein